ncbi:hypothetical protein QYF36_023869 [Acer negundo]|nr:hypothetical protein QYF36_023869 [Acer negundo]
MLSRFVTISRLCTRTITIPAYGNINATTASPARQAFSSVGSDHHGIVDAAAAAKDSYTKRRLDYSEKVWLCRLHNGNPEVYTVARLAKDYKCSMQLVETILREYKIRRTVELSQRKVRCLIYSKPSMVCLRSPKGSRCLVGNGRRW